MLWFQPFFKHHLYCLKPFLGHWNLKRTAGATAAQRTVLTMSSIRLLFSLLKCTSLWDSLSSLWISSLALYNRKLLTDKSLTSYTILLATNRCGWTRNSCFSHWSELFFSYLKSCQQSLHSRATVEIKLIPIRAYVFLKSSICNQTSTSRLK